MSCKCTFTKREFVVYKRAARVTQFYPFTAHSNHATESTIGLLKAITGPKVWPFDKKSSLIFLKLHLDYVVNKQS